MAGSPKTVGDRVLKCLALAVLVCANLPAAETTLSLGEVAARKPPDFTPVLEGHNAVVSGQVSGRAVYIANYVHLAIQERGHGLILETVGPMFDHLSPGDWVEAHGRVTERWGLPVVAVSKIAIVSTGAPPLPEPIDPARAQDLRRIGQLIVTEGPVIETGSNFGGAFLRLGVFPTSLKVFLPSSPGTHPSLAAFTPGEVVRVTGILYQYCPNPPYTNQFELLIGDVKDVALASRGWIHQVRAFWPVLALLAILGCLWWRSEVTSRRQREMLRTIYGLGEEVLTAAAPQEILQKISEVLPRVLEVSGARMYLHDRGGKMLNPVGEPGASGTSLDAPVGLLQTSAVTCFKKGTPLSIADARRHPFRVAGEPPSFALPRSVLFVPMLAQGEPVGVFQLHTDRRPRTFSRDEEAVAQHLANQMGLAVKLLQQRSFREQLSRTEKLAAVGRLISGVVNDLQTPLEAISSMADSALAEHIGSAPGHELLVIASEARRAAAIVTRLISFAQPEQAQAEPVELQLMLRNLIQFRDREWKACGIQLTNLTKGKALWVLGSQGQLEQVFLNLFVHAEQALEEAPEKRIAVRMDRMAGHVYVEIVYSAPLRRPSGVLPQSDAGALGLDICGSIVAGHGGELRISERDGASRFEIELAAVPGDQFAPEVNDAGRAPSPRRWTALLLEQEEFVERTLIEWLSNRGYRVVPVGSSEEGLDLVQRLRFDVVFCSTHLRGLNWVEFFDRVRGRVGAFTLLAEAFSQDLSTHFRGEGRYVLHKPIEQSQFDRTLAAVEGRLASVESRAPEVESY
jgi:signal transduction histidine kinase/CheY-like chemotaxis protein